MLSRYHEAPLCIFDEVQKRTDGDYALVHLFETDELYYSKFEQAVRKGRDVILDNSLFELHESGRKFDAKKFINWVDTLKPRYYIVPDSWRDGRETIRMFKDFIEIYPRPIEGRIGVAQGKTFAEVAATYEQLEPYCEVIAFNFDFSDFWYSSNYGKKETNTSDRQAMTLGRMLMMHYLDAHKVINHDKKHHLLGCGVPQEIRCAKHFPWITSIDTCHPIMTGMTGYRYSEAGFNPKCEFKMCDHMHDELSEHQKQLIRHNLSIIENWLKEE